MVVGTILGCAVVAVLLVVVSPWLLTRGRWHVRRPALALMLWGTAVVLGLGAGTVAIASALGVTLGMRAASPAESIAAAAFSWLALAVIAALIAQTSATSERWDGIVSRRERRALHAHLPRHDVDGEPVLVADDAAPGAWSVGGRDRAIVVTSGAIALLTADELRAVVAHERAHLSHGHHLIRGLAALQSASIPWLPAARSLNRSSRLLVELVADDVAAKRAGAVHLANALAKVGASDDDAGMLLRAERLAKRTWLPGRGAVQDRTLRLARL